MSKLLAKVLLASIFTGLLIIYSALPGWSPAQAATAVTVCGAGASSANCVKPNSDGTISVTTSASSFIPKGAATLAVTGTTANVALPTSDATLIIQNVGAQNAFFNLGVGNGTTATTSNFSLPSGATISLGIGSNTYLAAITATGSTTLNLIQGTGAPQISGNTGPSGQVTSANSNGIVTSSDEPNIGVPGNAACGTDAGSCTLNAKLSRIAQNITSGTTTLVANNADAVAAAANSSIPSASYNFGFNGSTWDRLQVDGSKNLKVVNGSPGQTTMSASAPVTIASDQAAFPVNPAATTTGGVPTTYIPTIGASDNHANVKNGAGNAYFIMIGNNSSTINYWRLYDAGSGFNGCGSATNIKAWGIIPGNSTNGGGIVMNFGTMGLHFSTGISICVTSGFGQTDTTNATATAIALTLGYD